MRLVYSLITIVFTAGLLSADDAPMSIASSVVAAEAQSGPALEVKCQNKSKSTIAAYVLRFDNRNADGKLGSRESISMMTAALGLSKGRPGFAPGESWVDRHPVKSATPPAPQLDLVVFADGSHWGPNLAKKLDKILGVRAGAQASR